MSPRLLRLSIGVVTGLLASLAYLGVRSSGPSPASRPEAQDPFLARPYTAPPLSLIDPGGDTVQLTGFQGRTVALFFGYAQCPDICPITLAQLTRLQTELDPEGRRLQIVFVSLDPARDTPGVLQAYVERFGPGVVALTAPLEQLRPQVLEFGIGFLYRPVGGGASDSVPPLGPDYLVDHTARTFIVDSEGQVVAQLALEADGATLRAALTRVLSDR